MALADEVAERLARDVMTRVRETGDDSLIARVSATLGEQSQTLQEAFTVAIRVLLAEERARALLKAPPG
jgi:hypothetical protein